jgi:GH24 family phage-related lysozyme (muramidase)
MNEQTRKNIYEQLKLDEGVVHEIYLDHLGYKTCGVGHLIVEGDDEYGLPVGTPITEERTFELFNKDLDLYISECNILYGTFFFDTLPEEVKEILVNMIFNLGRTRLSKFKKMNKAIFSLDWKNAAKEGRDSLWYNQVTNRAERLMSRLESV